MTTAINIEIDKIIKNYLIAPVIIIKIPKSPKTYPQQLFDPIQALQRTEMSSKILSADNLNTNPHETRVSEWFIKV